MTAYAYQGAGAKQWKKTPDIEIALKEEVKDAVAGDPMSEKK